MNLPYTSYKNFMIKRHGDALYRIPIDFNFGCPNREKDGSGGCTFCNIRGSAAVNSWKEMLKSKCKMQLIFLEKDTKQKSLWHMFKHFRQPLVILNNHYI